MQGGDEENDDLTGALLVAHPALKDPNFRRAVIFLAAHGEDGALGFILNKPTQKTVADFIPQEEALGVLSDVPVYFGGPVGDNQLVIAVFQWQPDLGEVTCAHNLSVEDVAALAEDEHTTVRAFVGHAGWTEGQLEHELTHDSWIVRPPQEGILDPQKSKKVWVDTMRELGPWFRLEAEAPDDPSLN